MKPKCHPASHAHAGTRPGSAGSEPGLALQRGPRAVNRVYGGRAMAELKAERRERLMNAAYALIGREGYARLSIERTCAAARVATRHYYEHFQGREALLHGLFDRVEAELWQAVTRALTEPGVETGERSGAAIRAFVRHALSDPIRARIMCLESVGVSAELEEKRRRLIRRFAELIHQVSRQLAADGVLPAADYRLSGIALVGATNELLVEWISGGMRLTVEEMELQVLNIFRALTKGAVYAHHEAVGLPILPC
ncbi:TetR/AcrR family transcriptional regulator [Solimonas variicoloris]|uniref:TetR/AcrR family transcriptional regulator n=1 Tax=Solimonas variicoloris TaxID=254408 RepID=UPI00039991ED|nr:TetR/AcrR family transcriptional regulator [Solimonas variicoloris]